MGKVNKKVDSSMSRHRTPLNRPRLLTAIHANRELRVVLDRISILENLDNNQDVRMVSDRLPIHQNLDTIRDIRVIVERMSIQDIQSVEQVVSSSVPQRVEGVRVVQKKMAGGSVSNGTLATQVPTSSSVRQDISVVLEKMEIEDIEISHQNYVPSQHVVPVVEQVSVNSGNVFIGRNLSVKLERIPIQDNFDRKSVTSTQRSSSSTNSVGIRRKTTLPTTRTLRNRRKTRISQQIVDGERNSIRKNLPVVLKKVKEEGEVSHQNLPVEVKEAIIPVPIENLVSFKQPNRLTLSDRRRSQRVLTIQETRKRLKQTRGIFSQSLPTVERIRSRENSPIVAEATPIQNVLSDQSSSVREVVLSNTIREQKHLRVVTKKGKIPEFVAPIIKVDASQQVVRQEEVLEFRRNLDVLLEQLPERKPIQPSHSSRQRSQVSVSTMTPTSETRGRSSQNLPTQGSEVTRELSIRLSPLPVIQADDDQIDEVGNILDDITAADAVVDVMAPPPGVPLPPAPAPEVPRRVWGENIPHRRTWKKAVNTPVDDIEQACRFPFTLGNMDDDCVCCGAKFFPNEFPVSQGSRRICCRNGAITLPPLADTPRELVNLFTGNTAECAQFRDRIRYINGLFAMASFTTSVPGGERDANIGRCFAVTGQIYHYYNGVPNTQDLAEPRLNHYYFLDVNDAMAHRAAFTEDAGIDLNVFHTIENVLRDHNPYVRAYKSMAEQLRIERQRRPNVRPLDDVYIAFLDNMNQVRRNYNLPESTSDIAALFVGAEPPFRVELILYPRIQNQPLRHHRIDNLNKMADPMVYPLLFPCGDAGRSIELKARDGKTVSCRQFYRYRIQIRDGFSNIHYGMRLFLQYVVDAWCKAESDVLWYIRHHQNKFRLTTEEVLARYYRRRGEQDLENGEEQGRIGRPVVLPISFEGGERNLQRRFQEAMAVIARFGKPDLFVTFTCNPRWPEITRNLLPHQRYEHRPDLLCRVFSAKLKEFINDIVQKQIFGVVLNYHYVVEFQKRGLPHIHMLITFVNADRIITADDVDGIISATIPNRNEQEFLHHLVQRNQIHSACINGVFGEVPCIKEDGSCRFRFPMRFANETIVNRGSNQRPIYKRPQDGRTVTLAGGEICDNTRVVPYNAYVLAKYQCHLNFEAVGSVRTMKYLHKYLTKGVDSIEVDVDANQDLDEVQRYLNCRYVSSVEATWRLFEFKMHDRSHSVMLLPVHLPGFRDIVFEEDEDIQQLEAILNRPSKLEAFFALNAVNAEARNLLYNQIPEYFTWNTRESQWVPRQMISKMIGTVYEVSPNDPQIEKFYLRILLLHTRGPTSFEHLRTVDGELLPDFKTACDRRNLLRNGVEYDRCMAEAVLRHFPCRLRRLFATICSVVTDDDLAQISPLWDRYLDYMIQDFQIRGMTLQNSVLRCYNIVNRILQRSRPGLTLDILGIRIDGNQGQQRQQDNEDDVPRNDDDDNEDDNDGNITASPPVYQIEKLNADQQVALIKILHAIKFLTRFGPLPVDLYLDLDKVPIDILGAAQRPPQSNMFYLDGPGGTGKTYVYNTLLTYIQQILRLPTVAVAWTGIAANLLIGGKTVHRQFRLPLDLTETTVAGYPLENNISQFLKRAAVIVWDEAPMSPRFAVEAVDRYMREVMDNQDVPFGGKCVVFGGDFRQILPVVKGPGSGRNEIVNACLKNSHLWRHVTKLTLQINMRARTVQQLQRQQQGRTRPNPNLPIDHIRTFGCMYHEWLLKIGEGRLEYADFSHTNRHAPRNLVEVPKSVLVNTVSGLIEFVYGDAQNQNNLQLDNEQRAILCPTNRSVTDLNRRILEKVVGESVSYFSIDSYREGPNDNFHVPMDMVNAVDVPSLPPHELVLKRGVIVMLLRNIDLQAGQCNGTRLKVLNLYEHFVECQILTGTSRGRVVWIPKLKMSARDSMLPQTVDRFQFPLRLAYCMTINKAQGQTFDKVGIYLDTPCFAHGQLYVAFSRVGLPENVKVFIQPSSRHGIFSRRSTRCYTCNVVYYEIFHDTNITATRRQQSDNTESESSQETNNSNNNTDNDGDNDSFLYNVPIPDDASDEVTPPEPFTFETDHSDENDDMISSIPPRRANPRNYIAFQRTPSPRRQQYYGSGDESDDGLGDAVPVRRRRQHVVSPSYTNAQLRARVSKGEMAGTSKYHG